VLTTTQALEESSDVAAIELAQRMGPDRFYQYIHGYRFGMRSGIELPGETRGLVKPPARWQPTTIGSIPMGQEIAVTPIQLVTMASSIANGGVYLPPHIVLESTQETRGSGTLKAAAFRPEEELPNPLPAGAHRVISEMTSAEMRKMMEGVVLFGTGRRYANLQGYSSAGKTGSAQIFDYATGHYTHIYNASFMGFAPVTNPAIVVVVTVNATHGGSAGYGGPVAGPVFRAVASETLRVLDVPKDLPDTVPDTGKTQVADLDEVPTISGHIDPPELGESEAQVAASQPSAPVYGPQPKPADPAEQARVKQASGPKAPNLIGLSMRSVVTLAQAQGLDVVLAGTGIVRRQEPPPGAILHGGERIRVDLAR
jgi:cell division protein FtsI (penicillin-binding protein 3)